MWEEPVYNSWFYGEGWICQSRVPQEPGRQRGDDGNAEDRGHEVTASQGEAEIIVINTCGFIESAKQESIDTILEMAQEKKRGRCRRLIVAGCLVARYRQEILESIPEVDAVIGTNELPGHSAGLP